ncbi:MAG: hypothetical protein NC321_10945 [Clostridium sp.]|nr:hypothetical protein [Clostridium sp.]
MVKLQGIKKAFKKIFCLPPIPTVLIALPSYGMVIYTLTKQDMHPAVMYASYILSAYALVISVTGITGVVHFIRQGIESHPLIKKALDVPLINKYLKEDTFRAETSLYQGFFINFLYAGIKMFSGIYYKSIWFVTLAIYYILLAVMRFSLLHYVRRESEKNNISEWQRYRLCGMILLFMNVALSGIITLAVRHNSGFEYPGMLIYAMALYTFYTTIMAVRNVIKFRRYGSPVLSAAKVISLTAALVSMLSLETAMLTQFGAADDADFRRMMTASTGAGVGIIVLGMAVFMIIHSTRQIRKQPLYKGENEL